MSEFLGEVVDFGLWLVLCTVAGVAAAAAVAGAVAFWGVFKDIMRAMRGGM